MLKTNATKNMTDDLKRKKEFTTKLDRNPKHTHSSIFPPNIVKWLARKFVEELCMKMNLK